MTNYRQTPKKGKIMKNAIIITDNTARVQVYEIRLRRLWTEVK